MAGKVFVTQIWKHNESNELHKVSDVLFDSLGKEVVKTKHVAMGSGCTEKQFNKDSFLQNFTLFR